MLQRRVGKLRPEFNETVLINQTGFDSEYFRIDEVPEILTSGKNMFKIYGNNNLLIPNSQIIIQVTDINGSPIYHHVNNYVDPTGRIIIGVWIYPETPPGLGRIQIMGIASRRPDGRSITPAFRNKFNVKWSKEVIIQPGALNNTPIVFQKIPGVKIFENQREYLTQTYVAGSSIATQNVGTISYTYNGYGDATIQIHDAIFSSSMAGGLLTVNEPAFTLPSGYSLQPGVMDNETGNLPAFTGYITQVLSSTTAKIDPYVLPVTSQVSTPMVSYANNAGARETSQPAISTVNSSLPVSTFGQSAYEIEWQQDAILSSGSNNSQSFASITLKNIEPIAGNVHKIKTYMKSAGFADFNLVSTNLLLERDLLINVDSDLAFDRIGDYKRQEIINNFWHSESVDPTGAAGKVFAVHDDSIIISAMKISGSAQIGYQSDYPSPPLPSDPYIKVYSKPDIEIYQNNEYQVKFKVANEPHVEGQESSSLMDIYISGSNIGSTDGRNIGHKLLSLETTNRAPTNVSNVLNYTNLVALSNNPSSPVNIPSLNTANALAVRELPATFTANAQPTTNANSIQSMDERLLEISFTPDFDTDAHIVFAVSRGDWYLSDVSLEAASDFGFTPNHTFLEIPIETARADDVLDFKFEFYNIKDEIANISLTTQSLDFVGSNLFISGNSNVLSGSVNIGDGILMTGFSVR